MNAQNNTPQQRPAAAASTPTESDLWEAAFSSDDPTVVLTDEDLNAAPTKRRARRPLRRSPPHSPRRMRPAPSPRRLPQPSRSSPPALPRRARNPVLTWANPLPITSAGSTSLRPPARTTYAAARPLPPLPHRPLRQATRCPHPATPMRRPVPRRLIRRMMTTSLSPPPQVMPLARNPSSPPQPHCPCRRAATPACTCCPAYSAG